ncbi:MAG: sigma-54 interaction domain-containing protein, partial [Bacillota bacterium]
ELFLKGFTADKIFEDIIGESTTIKNTINEAKKYARVDMPLLIYGETGTGKELFAQAIHNYSLKSREPFVAFNCAAVPEELLESELFGYVEGAFTGASKKGKTGLFEQAHGGTLFLDEIGEVSLNTQAKLLRVFEERKIRKIGDDKLTPVDVRLILATNKSLSELVKKGKFREDLYYRINVLKLNLPPLRKREIDIPLLVNYFIKKSQNKTNKIIRGISTKGMELLKGLEWPGNVRQLENTIERLCVKSESDYISKELVEETIENLAKNIERDIFNNYELPKKSLEEFEKEIIKKVLEEEGGNKSSAAERLKIGRTTLWRKLNK